MLLDNSITPVVATFLITFAIFYFLLTKSKMFDKQKNVVVVLSLAIALFSSASPLTSFLQSFFPVVILLLFIITGIFLLKDLTSKIGKEDITPTVILLATSLILVYVLWDEINSLLPRSLDQDNVLWIIGIVVIVFLFFIVNKLPSK